MQDASGNNIGLNELRKAVVNDPRNADLRYLLGAEMAQQKDYDGAVMEMSAAIAFNPLLHLARFQLGLLHLTMARADHALTVLAPLENLDDSAPLKHFKRGLEALIRDEFAPCIAHLRKGIELNSDNEPLNRDMQLLIDRVSSLTPPHTNAASPSTEFTADEAATTEYGEASVRTDFSLYGTRN